MSVRNLFVRHGGDLNRVLKILQNSRRHVMVLAPFSSSRRSRSTQFNSYEVTGNQAGDTLFDQFVRDFAPKLIERDFQQNPGHGLKVLDLPTWPGTGDDSRSFILHRNSYFFRRASQSSEHPFWKKLKGNSQDQHQHQQKPPGHEFILQIRTHLKHYGRFIAQHRVLLNTFNILLAEFSSRGGMAPRTKITPLPTGLAEVLIDFFFADPEPGSDEVPQLDLSNVKLESEGNKTWEFATGGQLEEATKTLETLAKASWRYLNGYCYPQADRFDGRDLSNLAKGTFDQQTGLVEGFRKAKGSLLSLREMLSCHALAQQSLQWLIDGLLKISLGENTENRTDQDYDKVSSYIITGIKDKIAEPIKKLDAHQRIKMLASMKEKIAEYTKALSSKTEGERPEKIKEATWSNLLEVVNKLKSNDANENGEQMSAGLKDVLQLILETEVAPALFSVPELRLGEILQRSHQLEFSCVFYCLITDEQKTRDGLTQIGKETASRISEALAAKKFDKVRDKLEDVALDKMLNAFSTAAQKSIHQLKLFKIAQELNKGSIPPFNRISSSIGALRSGENPTGETKTCIDQTEIGVKALGIDKRFTHWTMDRLLEEFRLKAQIDDLVKKNSGDTGVEVGEVGVSAGTKGTGRMAATQAIPRHTPEIAVQNEVKNNQGEIAEKRKLLNSRLEQLKETTETLSSDVEIKIIKGVTTDSNAETEEAEHHRKIRESLQNLVQKEIELKGAGKTENDFKGDPGYRELEEDFAKQVLEALKSSRNEGGNDSERNKSIQDTLRVAEELRHKMFTRFTAAVGDQETLSIPFRRMVETMLLGRIMASARAGAGLSGTTRGLFGAVLDLLELTGEKGDDEIKPEELLKKKPLNSYLDNLDSGQKVKGLIDDLGNCAEQSLRNISNFVSELNGLYYLFSKAPQNTVISIFNGTWNEFVEWVTEDNLEPEGKSRFSMNSNLAHPEYPVKRPGLILVSPSAFQNQNSTLPNLRQGDLSYGLPPMAISCPKVVKTEKTQDAINLPNIQLDVNALPFPIWKLGPSNTLNSRDDPMGTHLPAIYPLGAHFLGASSDDLLRDRHGNVGSREPNERVLAVPGISNGVKSDFDAALMAMSPDYFLHLIEVLFGDLRHRAANRAANFGNLWGELRSVFTKQQMGNAHINAAQEIASIFEKDDLIFQTDKYFFTPFPRPAVPNDGNANPSPTTSTTLVNDQNNDQNLSETLDFSWFDRAIGQL